MPCCCCGVLGDPYPYTSYEEIPEYDLTRVAAGDVYGLFFGGIGIVGVVLFLPAVVLLEAGQKKKTSCPALCCYFGFGLMLFWVCAVCVISFISWDAFPHDFVPAIKDEWILSYSDLLKNTIYVLAAEIVLALSCALILFCAPIVDETDSIVSG